jgi:hypothetical protein
LTGRFPLNPAPESEVKQQVREFYDQVGWQVASVPGAEQVCYQNARYEDLRPVSQEYIHRCHLRVARFLAPAGDYLLDAGSGPIQYPEYLEYSRGYRARVCADISIVALQEARKRVGDRQTGGHGLFVVADIASLPFKSGAFDGVVSLHTIHHLPAAEHERAYGELYRVLAPQCSAVVVNGWERSPFMRPFALPIRWGNRLRRKIRRVRDQASRPPLPGENLKTSPAKKPLKTYVDKNNAARLRQAVGPSIALEIWTWRSVNVGFLRTFIHPALGGRWFLRVLFWLEERFPHFFGVNGQYPLIVIRKMENS